MVLMQRGICQNVLTLRGESNLDAENAVLRVEISLKGID